MSHGLSRRGFLIATAATAGGLTLTIGLRRTRRRGDPRARSSPFAWLRIAPDGTVTIQLDRTEMGQGVTTALSMVLAEELGVGWNAVRLGPVVNNPAGWSRLVETGASRSVRHSVELLKHAGAAAREMLIAAAASQWSVAPSSCRVVEGVIHHPASGRILGYGSIAARAATLEPPPAPSLMPVDRHRLLGKRLPRLDTRAKVTGQAQYGIDVKLPGMLVASIERSPVPEATSGGSTPPLPWPCPASVGSSPFQRSGARKGGAGRGAPTPRPGWPYWPTIIGAHSRGARRWQSSGRSRKPLS